MKYIALWSGGKDSTATIILAHEHGEPLDEIVMAEVMFDLDRNISGENPDHMRWVHEVAVPMFESWGYKVTIVRSDKYSFLTQFYAKLGEKSKKCGCYQGWLINNRCQMNDRGKMRPIKKYMKDVGECMNYVGIAIDEPIRLERMHQKLRNVSLLEKYNIRESDAHDLCARYGLLSPMYNISKRGGCWFCPNQRTNELMKLKSNHPELWAELQQLGKFVSTKKDEVYEQHFDYEHTWEEIEKIVEFHEMQISIFDEETMKNNENRAD